MTRNSEQLETARYRRIMGHYPTGVTVVTALTGDRKPVGLTANSVTSVSLDPPLVLVCLAKESASLGVIHESGVFAVNILEVSDADLATRFASVDRARRFEGVGFTSRNGAPPILDSALAWLECRIYKTFEAGDHMIVVGNVTGGGMAEGEPLLFYRGRYGRLTE